MLKKYGALFSLFIHFSTGAMQDAQILAQGYASEDGYVNPERVAEISRALSIIRRDCTELSDVYAWINSTITVSLPYPQIELYQDLYSQINAITQQFKGETKICDVDILKTTYWAMTFKSDVDIPSLIKRYSAITGVKRVYQVMPLIDEPTKIILKDTNSRWYFTFINPKSPEGLYKEYKISYDPINSVIINEEI